uniref:Uncharacterized protein n=1 Tax=Avena sativa TaxID=4498 RepID=A0ACD5YTJ6_AVESA
MEIMDPYTDELLSAPPLPAAHQTEFDDDYLRAIGALPARSRAHCAPAAAAALEPASVMLPAPWDLFAAAHVIQQPAVEAPVPHQQPKQQRDRKRVAPAPDVTAASDNSSAKRPRTCPWVPDYDADIDVNLREKERNARQQPSPDYLKTVQEDRMDETTRADLITWMDDFTKHFVLAPGTLHRAVSYVDRVLSARALSTTDTDYELRVLGAAAVFAAAKYEQRSTIRKLNAKDIAAYCGFTAGKEVTDMEREVLATLRYELGGPTAHTFVDHFTRNSRGDRNMEIRRRAHELADASLVEYGCLQFLPSAVAATALLLARLMVNPADKQEYFEDLTGYKPVDLIDGIHSMLRTNPNSRSVILPALSQYL